MNEVLEALVELRKNIDKECADITSDYGIGFMDATELALSLIDDAIKEAVQ